MDFLPIKHMPKFHPQLDGQTFLLNFQKYLYSLGRILWLKYAISLFQLSSSNWLNTERSKASVSSSELVFHTEPSWASCKFTCSHAPFQQYEIWQRGGYRCLFPNKPLRITGYPIIPHLFLGFLFWEVGHNNNLHGIWFHWTTTMTKIIAFSHLNFGFVVRLFSWSHCNNCQACSSWLPSSH